MSRPLRILYAAGPGDVINTYRFWKARQDDPAQVAITYSAQFYDLCQDLQADGYIISYHPQPRLLHDDRFTLEHRPLKWNRAGAIKYHLGQIAYGLRLALTARRWRADLAIVSGGTHWFMLSLMSMLGVRVVPTLHCVLWPKFEKRRSRLVRLIRALDGRFFRRHAAAVLSINEAINEQVRELAGETVPIVRFIPVYRPESFGDGLPPPPAPSATVPFRVFFAGRIETNKGVFDLLQIAKQFAAAGRLDIEFDLCGEGSQLAPLRAAAEQAGVAARFRCHGHLQKPAMRAMFEAAHVVIVPTTTDFVEGFNKVVIEGVLSGRPVITSSVCTLEYLDAAVVEVPPNDVAAYAAAILMLRDDAAAYAQKRTAAQHVRSIFYDPARSWHHAARQAVALCANLPDTTVDPRRATL